MFTKLVNYGLAALILYGAFHLIFFWWLPRHVQNRKKLSAATAKYDDEMSRIWTDEQVANLNRYQRSAVFHPYTCVNYHGRKDRNLMATPWGWVCPNCDYTGTKAMEMMLNFTEDEYRKHRLSTEERSKDDQ